MMVPFQKKKLEFGKKSYYLWLLVEKSTVHSMSAPHEQGIVELKENYAHVNDGPTVCN